MADELGKIPEGIEVAEENATPSLDITAFQPVQINASPKIDEDPLSPGYSSFGGDDFGGTDPLPISFMRDRAYRANDGRWSERFDLNVDPGWSGAFGAAFGRENIIGADLVKNQGYEESVYLGKSFIPSPDYDPFKDDGIVQEMARAFPKEFREVHSPGDGWALASNLRREQERTDILDEVGGFTSFTTSTVAAVVDPTIVIPGGQITKVARVGTAALRSAGVVGAHAALGVGVQEGILQGYQSARPWQESALNVGGGFVLGGALGGALGARAGRSAIREADIEKVADVTFKKERFDRSVQALSINNMAKSGPDALKERIQELLPPDSSISIPSREFVDYFQSNDIDPFSLSDEFGLSVREAYETGTDVIVPLDVYYPRIAPDHHVGLSEHIRFTEDGFTAAEAAVISERGGFGDVVARAEFDDADIYFDTSEMDAIRDDIFNQLKNAGVTEKMARSYTDASSAYFETMSERVGISPTEFYSLYGQRIIGESTTGQVGQPLTPLELAIETIKAPGNSGSNREYARFRRRYGPGLLEWLSRRGGLFDVGGDLSALGAQNWNVDNPFMPSLIRPFPDSYNINHDSFISPTIGLNERYGYDDAALNAWEAGYLTDDPFTGGRPDINALLDAISEELAGNYRTSLDARISPNINVEMADYLESIEDLIGRLDIDLSLPSRDIARILESELPLGLRADSFVEQMNEFLGVKAPRGAYSPDFNIIRIFSNRDASTFLHEMGHSWLEINQRITREFSDTPEISRLREDNQKVLDWLGVKEGQPITREQHEKYARAVETYFLEGKAPTDSLKEAFANFRRWMIRVYKSLLKRGEVPEELNPEIREIFDRMLASDAALARSSSEYPFDVSPNILNAAGPSARSRLRTLSERAKMDAENKAYLEVLEPLISERKKWWAEEARIIRPEIEEIVRNDPIWKIRDTTTGINRATGEKVEAFKFNRALVENEFGPGSAGVLPRGMTSKDGILVPDQVAAAYGYDSAHDMIAALAGTRGVSFKQAVDSAVQSRMKEIHGDPLNDGSLEEIAEQVIRERRRIELLVEEANVLRDQANKSKNVSRISGADRRELTRSASAPLKRQARDNVDELDLSEIDASVPQGTARSASTNAMRSLSRNDIEGAKVAREEQILNQYVEDFMRARGGRELSRITAKSVASDVEARISTMNAIDLGKSLQYRAQAKRLRALADRAAATGDFGKASVAKDLELFNVEMYRQARVARERIDTMNRYFTKIRRPNAQRRIGKAGGGFLDQINNLLASFETKPRSQKELTARAQYNEWAAMRENSGLVIPQVDQAIIDRAGLTNYREMPFSDLTSLYDTIRAIEHTASFENKLMREQEAKTISEIASDLRDAADNSGLSVKIVSDDPNLRGNRFVESLKDAAAKTLKASTVFELLDGGNPSGPWSRTFMDRIRSADNANVVRQRLEAKKALEITKILEGEDIRSERTIVDIPGQGKLTVEARMAIAVHSGNPEGLARLLEQQRPNGTGLTMEGIEAARASLSQKHYRFLEAMTDHIDEFWPEIRSLEERFNGVAPKKVEALPFRTVTSDGATIDYKGGYFPLKYDKDQSTAAAQFEVDQSFADMQNGRAVSSQTRRGHTIERKSGVRLPVLYSIEGYPQHIREVVNDLVMREPVSDAYKLLKNKEIAGVITDRMGSRILKDLDLWVKDIAVGRVQTPDTTSGIINRVRSYSSISMMGFSATTMLSQFTGLFQAIPRLGAADVGRGITQFLSNPVMSIRAAEEASEFLRTRSITLNRDLADVVTEFEGKRGAFNRATSRFSQYAFYGMVQAQRIIDISVWQGAYNKALREGNLVEEAISYADAIVSNTQSSGLISNLSAIERGTLSEHNRFNPWVRLFTVAYSYFNTKLQNSVLSVAEFKRTGNFPKLVADFMCLYFLEATATALATGRGPTVEDDDNAFSTYALWATSETAGTFFGQVPIVSQIAGAASGFGAAPPGIKNLEGFGRSLGVAINSAGDLITGEEVNLPRLGRAISSGAGLVIPFPSTQVNRFITGAEKEDASFGDYILPQQ